MVLQGIPESLLVIWSRVRSYVPPEDDFGNHQIWILLLMQNAGMICKLQIGDKTKNSF